MKTLRIILEKSPDSFRIWIEHRKKDYIDKHGVAMPQPTLSRLYGKAWNMYNEGKRYNAKTRRIGRRSKSNKGQ